MRSRFEWVDSVMAGRPGVENPTLDLPNAIPTKANIEVGQKYTCMYFLLMGLLLAFVTKPLKNSPLSSHQTLETN